MKKDRKVGWGDLRGLFRMCDPYKDRKPKANPTLGSRGAKEDVIGPRQRVHRKGDRGGQKAGAQAGQGGGEQRCQADWGYGRGGDQKA